MPHPLTVAAHHLPKPFPAQPHDSLVCTAYAQLAVAVAIVGSRQSAVAMPHPRAPSPPSRRRPRARDDKPLDPSSTSSPTTPLKPPLSSNSEQFAALSLPRMLASARHAKAPPPASVISSGVVCLPPSAMQTASLCLLDVVILSTPTHSIVVQVWPLEAVPSQYLALPDDSLAALNLTPTLPPPSPARPSPRHKNKRSSGARARRVSNDPVLSPVAPPSDAACITISRISADIPSAKSVNLSPTDWRPGLDADEWADMLNNTLQRRLVRVGSVVRTTLLGAPVVLNVTSINPIADAARIDADTLVVVNRHEGSDDRPIPLLDSLAGLDAQRIELLAASEAALTPSPSHLLVGEVPVRAVPRGALLHGPPGVGKTLLACAVAEAVATHVEVVTPAALSMEPRAAAEAIEHAFSRARRRAPAVVVLDEVDAIAPSRDAPDADPGRAAVTAALLATLDGVAGRNDRVFAIGTTTRPQIVDAALRRAGRFDVEIDLPVPDARSRLDILLVLARTAQKAGRLDACEEEIRAVARVGYGYVGADLAALWREAVARALRRGPDAAVNHADLVHGLRVTRPSALRAVAVEVPATRWVDVGGMADAKRRLQEAVEWPLSSVGAARFRAAGVDPPRGVLLFGPPGCSKTLLARAVATESAANFIAVKGAELLSKWVGESERAVRATFRRARQAAPCVIFFDEVDALAPARGTAAGGSAQARVVAQLLAEMDGVHTTPTNSEKRVIVIAATNRPDCLDPAFIRPGRIDVQVYVGLPDPDERLEILNVHTRKVPLHDDVNLQAIASDNHTGNFSGAELGALVREAALSAMERDVENARYVDACDFEVALGRVRPRTPPEVLEYFSQYVEQLRMRGRS